MGQKTFNNLRKKKKEKKDKLWRKREGERGLHIQPLQTHQHKQEPLRPYSPILSLKIAATIPIIYNNRFREVKDYCVFRSKSQDSSMLRLWKWYQNCLATHPVKTQVISSGLIWGFGDIAAQAVTHSTSKPLHLQTSVSNLSYFRSLVFNDLNGRCFLCLSIRVNARFVFMAFLMFDLMGIGRTLSYCCFSIFFNLARLLCVYCEKHMNVCVCACACV